LQGFGPATSATVLRDRLIGVALGLIVFGILEHMLWPVRAADRMRQRLADVLRALAALARECAKLGGLRSHEVDSRRRLISEQVSDLQGLIESSKFESDTGNTTAIQQLTGDAQTVFVILLGIAHPGETAAYMAHEARARLLTDVAVVLEACAEHLRRGTGTPPIDMDEALASV